MFNFKFLIIMKKRMYYEKALLFGVAIIVFGLFSCDKETEIEIEVDGEKPPIELDCSIFTEDVTLTSDPDRPVDYIVDCYIDFSRITLTIEPGTVIEFTENGRINIERYFEDHTGAIIAKGTADQPIVFRGTKAVPGHWQGINIGTFNNVNELDYVIIRDAGSEPWSPSMVQGGLSIGSVNNGYGRVKLTNSQILNNRKYGLDITQTSSTLTEQHIISGNVFKDNETPVLAAIHTLHLLDPSNEFTGNTINEIRVDPMPNSTHPTLVDGTWHNHHVPYVFQSGVNINSKITIAPGAVLKFPVNSYLSTTDTQYGGTGGALIARGTAEEPIVFTGVEPIERLWSGIKIETHYPANEISHAIIEYTGINASDPEYVYNVKVGTSQYLKIHNVTFNHSNKSECAVWALYHDEWNYAIVDIDLSTIYVEEGHCVYRDY